MYGSEIEVPYVPYKCERPFKSQENSFVNFVGSRILCCYPKNDYYHVYIDLGDHSFKNGKGLNHSPEARSSLKKLGKNVFGLFPRKSHY